DRSHVRRASYTYWTIGHVLESGLVVPNRERPHRFNDLDAFLAFYQDVLARSSASEYEIRFSERYLNYLRRSESVDNEPVLIPEMRYAGLEAKHKYRLDFAVLNAHVMQFLGIEMSPSSSHMAVKNAKAKTQKAINEELAAKWEREMTKRREYFQAF